MEKLKRYTSLPQFPLRIEEVPINKEIEAINLSFYQLNWGYCHGGIKSMESMEREIDGVFESTIMVFFKAFFLLKNTIK
jgi:hypothetical protein